MRLQSPEISFLQKVNLYGSNVVLISQEHSGEINPKINAHISDPTTEAVVLEYFLPELAGNASRTPLIGKPLKNMWERSSFRTRCTNQDKLAELCKEAGKPVVVIDIANKPAYLVSEYLIPPVLGISGSITEAFSPEAGFAVKSFSAATLGMLILNLYHENRNEGLFDREKIHRYERLLLDAADARRVFVAEGIRQLAKKMQGSQIVVCYPKAHTRRIGEYLQNPSPGCFIVEKLKKFLYRTNFWLDFNIRQYDWNNQSSGWELTSKKALSS